MRLAIDAVGIRDGGGAQVLATVLRGLGRLRPDWTIDVFLLPRSQRAFEVEAQDGRVRSHEIAEAVTLCGRLAWINRGVIAGSRRVGADVLLALANLAPRQPAVPQLVMVHQQKALVDAGVGRWRLRERARLWWLRRRIIEGARQSRFVVVQTRVVRSALLALAPELEPHVRVIPSAARESQPPSQVRPAVEAALAAAGRPWLFYPASPASHKNHQMLIEAMRVVQVSFRAASLLLTVPESHGPTPFRRAAIGDAILRLGPLTPGEVDHLLERSDLLCFPSLIESFGLPLAEALSAGCPIVAADLPYAHEVAGDCAVYADPNSPTSFGEAIVTLLQDEQRREDLRRRGRARATRYSPEAVAREFVSLVEDAAASRTAHGH